MDVFIDERGIGILMGRLHTENQLSRCSGSGHIQLLFSNLFLDSFISFLKLLFTASVS